MKLLAYMPLFFAAVALASPTQPGLTPLEDDVFAALEKRRGCSENREETDVCKGKRKQPFNSFHNW